MRIPESPRCVTGLLSYILIIGEIRKSSCLPAFQSVSSCARESNTSRSARSSVHFFANTQKSAALKLPTVYLNRVGNDDEGSNRCQLNFLSDGYTHDDTSSAHFFVKSRLIEAMSSGLREKIPTAMLTFSIGAAIFSSTALLTPTVCMAEINPQDAVVSSSSTNTNNNRLKRTSRYWTMMESSDQSQIMAANENLIDQAVGTINTMYYDNSGGADFSPKDVYDRWKVLRVYAKEGGEGVKAINNNEAMKQKRLRDKELRDKENEQQQPPQQQEQLTTRKDAPFYGNGFSSQLFTVQGDSVKLLARSPNNQNSADEEMDRTVPSHAFDSRDRAVASLKWLVSTLGDPYSKYLTREELQAELQVRDYSFLGLGAIVEAPPRLQGKVKYSAKNGGRSAGQEIVLSQSKNPSITRKKSGESSSTATFLTSTRVANLPIVTAIVPDSPAERAGIVVGDRFAAIGSDKLVGLGRDEVIKKLSSVYSGADNYVGYPDVTVAKPISRVMNTNLDEDATKGDSDSSFGSREDVVGYKLSRVRLPTMSVEPFKPYTPLTESPQINENALTASGNPTDNIQSNPSTTQFISGGDAIVHYELLTPDASIFRRSTTLKQDAKSGDGYVSENKDLVGYIRITRFSRSATNGYVNAINELEKAGAKSYIIDVRNNYGGVIQESMLTAASLLRDPHTVLCYTMNSRGGFTPHDAEEYIVDERYPGYLLSSEKPSVTLQQVKRDNPEFVNESGKLQWYPPSSYASLREQRVTRGIRPVSGVAPANAFELDSIISSRKNSKRVMEERKQLSAQKKIVLLINEGTASAAEVFVSSLHDNGRTVSLVGTRTYGKGLIQHTFPMPDGGGLRLTVAEYLTPALQHVTKVGNARRYWNGDIVRGGILPDTYCSTKQGIPSNVGADLCVGIALDALEDADAGNVQDALAVNTAKAKPN